MEPDVTTSPPANVEVEVMPLTLSKVPIVVDEVVSKVPVILELPVICAPPA